MSRRTGTERVPATGSVTLPCVGFQDFLSDSSLEQVITTISRLYDVG